MCARHPSSRPPGAARPWTLLLALLAVATTTGLRTATAATGRLVLTVVDRQTKQPIPCRMHLRTAAGRPHRPPKASFWHDHFPVAGKITLDLPLGEYFFELERGPEYVERTGHFTINRFADDAQEVDMLRFVDMSADGWWSGDLDVRRPARDIERLMLADDLHVAPVVTWANDKAGRAAPSLADKPLVRFDGDRFYHLLAGKYACPGGTFLLANLGAPLDLAAPSQEYPPPPAKLERVRQHEGAWVDLTRPFWWDLPTLVAHGQIDSIQVAHSQLRRDGVINEETGGKMRDTSLFPGVQGNGRWSQTVYFHLLECGLRIPPSAGSGSGEAPNPLGYNRLYVHVDGELAYEKWWESLRAGRVVITNGPLLRPRVRGELPGHVFQAEAGQSLDFQIGLTLSTREPISYLEIIKNGQVEHFVRFDEYAKNGRLPPLRFDQSGWFLVRAVTDLGKTYRFAMTGPYYVHVGYQPRISKRSAQFFFDWVYERARQIQLEDPAQQRAVLDYHRRARDFWQDVLQRANAD